VSDRLSDLQEEAAYIERMSTSIERLRKQHRQDVVRYIAEDGAPVKELAQLLFTTKAKEQDG